MHYLCITRQSKNASAGIMIQSNLFAKNKMAFQFQVIILGVFLMLYFLKACYLQGAKNSNALLINILTKNQFPVIFIFSPVIFSVIVPVIPCYFYAIFYNSSRLKFLSEP